MKRTPVQPILLSTLLCLGLQISAQAANIIFTSDNLFGLGSISFIDPAGMILSDGDLVRVGTFDNEAALAAGLPISTLEATAGWHSFGELEISSPFGYAGKIYGEIGNNTAVANTFNNKPLYIWIFNAATSADATSQGIFRALAAVDAWTFPANQYGVGDSITLNIDDLTLQAIEQIGNVDTEQSQAKLVPIDIVPEPSTMALAGVSLLAMGGYRWLRNRASNRPRTN